MAKAREAVQQVRIRVVCLDPPPNGSDGGETEFGLQDKKQVLHAGLQAEDGSLRFNAVLAVKRHPRTAGASFGGPFVHGTADEQFLYLGWRLAHPAISPWIRRGKIMLGSINWQQVEQASTTAAGLLQAVVPGLVASRPPIIGGWSVVHEVETD